MTLKISRHISKDDNRCVRWCIELPDQRRIWVRSVEDMRKIVRELTQEAAV